MTVIGIIFLRVGGHKQGPEDVDDDSQGEVADEKHGGPLVTVEVGQYYYATEGYYHSHLKRDIMEAIIVEGHRRGELFPKSVCLSLPLYYLGKNKFCNDAANFLILLGLSGQFSTTKGGLKYPLEYFF